LEKFPEKEYAVLFVQKSQILSHMGTPALSILSLWICKIILKFY